MYQSSAEARPQGALCDRAVRTEASSRALTTPLPHLCVRNWLHESLSSLAASLHSVGAASARSTSGASCTSPVGMLACSHAYNYENYYLNFLEEFATALHERAGLHDTVASSCAAESPACQQARAQRSCRPHVYRTHHGYMVTRRTCARLGLALIASAELVMICTQEH